jgi:hypothetical protein
MDLGTATSKGFDSSKWSFRDYTVSLGLALITADRSKTIVKFDNAWEKFDQWTKTTPWQKHQTNFDAGQELGFTRSEKGSYIKGPRYLLYYVMLPAVENVIKYSYRNRIQCEAVPVVLAVLRYKQDKGNYPDTLEQLIDAGYLQQVPMDPFSDKPLVYKKTDSNFILYSAGDNFVDDGGQVYYYKSGRPQIWGPTDKPGDAVFWPVPENKPKSK